MGSIDSFCKDFRFLDFSLLSVVSNSMEHILVVLTTIKDIMDLSQCIVLGSSIHIRLCVITGPAKGTHSV